MNDNQKRSAIASKLLAPRMNSFQQNEFAKIINSFLTPFYCQGDFDENITKIYQGKDESRVCNKEYCMECNVLGLFSDTITDEIREEYTDELYAYMKCLSS